MLDSSRSVALSSPPTPRASPRRFAAYETYRGGCRLMQAEMKHYFDVIHRDAERRRVEREVYEMGVEERRLAKQQAAKQAIVQRQMQREQKRSNDPPKQSAASPTEPKAADNAGDGHSEKPDWEAPPRHEKQTLEEDGNANNGGGHNEQKSAEEKRAERKRRREARRKRKADRKEQQKGLAKRLSTPRPPPRPDPKHQAPLRPLTARSSAAATPLSQEEFANRFYDTPVRSHAKHHAALAEKYAPNPPPGLRPRTNHRPNAPLNGERAAERLYHDARHVRVEHQQQLAAKVLSQEAKEGTPQYWRRSSGSPPRVHSEKIADRLYRQGKESQARTMMKLVAAENESLAKLNMHRGTRMTGNQWDAKLQGRFASPRGLPSSSPSPPA